MGRDKYSNMDINQLLLELVSHYFDDISACKVMLRHILRGATLEEAIKLTEQQKEISKSIRDRNRRYKNQWGIEE